MRNISTDIIIIGGGIAGLRTYNILQSLGYNTVLLEHKSLGNKQTIHSQGIIHGGLKYTLQGALTGSANALRNMPEYWKKCLNGTGILDLKDVKILADHQYLWSTEHIGGTLAQFFASKMLQGKIEQVTRKNYPQVLQHSNYTGSVYKLHEKILCMRSLLSKLSELYHRNIIKIDQSPHLQLHYTPTGAIQNLDIYIDKELYRLTGRRYIFTAGQNNVTLTQQLVQTPQMQVRPLHMVYVKSDGLPTLYGHCIGLGAKPRATITTHRARDGQSVRYIGGKLAEDGIDKTSSEQIHIARNLVTQLFPRRNFRGTRGTLNINRAEEKQLAGLKPEKESIHTHQNYIIGRPTKLVLAPVLAEKIIASLQNDGVRPSGSTLDFSHLKKPKIAEFPRNNGMEKQKTQV